MAFSSRVDAQKLDGARLKYFKLLKGVGPSICDVGKPAFSLYDCCITETTSMNNDNDVDVSSLGGWVPDVAVTCLLALLMLSERFQFTYSMVIVDKWELFRINSGGTAKPRNLSCVFYDSVVAVTGLKSPEKKVEDSLKFKSPLKNDSDSDWKDLRPYENVAPAAADYEDIIYHSMSSSSDHEDGKDGNVMADVDVKRSAINVKGKSWTYLVRDRKVNKVNKDDFWQIVDEKVIEKDGKTPLSNKYDEFGNKIDVANILTDTMLEDKGVEEVLKKYLPAKDIPSEETPVENTPVEKIVSYKFKFDNEDEEDKILEKLEDEMEVDGLFDEMRLC
ncbi:hypothetical protein Tco_1358198 [Tanacetum coccineum]